MTLEERYSQAAPRWRQIVQDLGFGAAYDQLVAQAPDTPNNAQPSLCDIGAGSGALSRAYVERHGYPATHVLLDQSAAMLNEAAADFPRATLVPGDLATYEPETPFDITLCAHVIEHCPCPQEALAHLARLTKPGGTLLLAVSKPHFCQVFIWLKWRHRWFSAARVNQMAQRCGLQPLKTIPFANGVPARISQGYVFTKPHTQS